MILGLGSDLVDIRRIDATLRRFGDRFTARIFTDGERRRCDRRAARAEGYARRFAAKEACAKALGTGFRQGVFWRDLEVVNLPSGQPGLRLSGGAARHPISNTRSHVTGFISVASGVMPMPAMVDPGAVRFAGGPAAMSGRLP